MSLNIIQKSNHKNLTRFSVASFKELLVISLPLVLLTLSISILALCDRYFLSHYSLESWKACSTATNLCYFYQMTLIMIAITGQAYIARLNGANKPYLIGPLIWQMIYFSFISMAITYPLSRLTELYLKGSEIQDLATLYFRYLSLANFLFPMGATLSSFYIGRGKTLFILIVNVLIHGVNIVLDYLLIFGVNGWFDPMGIKGAAIATITSQGCLCIVLLSMFLQKKYTSIYGTDRRKFNRILLFKILKIGIPRAFGGCMVVGSWILASYMLVYQGGDYLLVHTFGVSLFLILCPINEGMSQALITIVSHILGSKTIGVYRKLFNTVSIYLIITTSILAVPLLYMHHFTIKIFIHQPLSLHTYGLLKECCCWIWLVCIGSAISRIGTSLLTASQDTVFYARCSVINLLTMCLPVFLGIGYLGWAPTKFFLIDALNCFFLGLVFILRFIKNRYKKVIPFQVNDFEKKFLTT